MLNINSRYLTFKNSCESVLNINSRYLTFKIAQTLCLFLLGEAEYIMAVHGLRIEPQICRTAHSDHASVHVTHVVAVTVVRVLVPGLHLIKVLGALGHQGLDKLSLLWELEDRRGQERGGEEKE